MKTADEAHDSVKVTHEILESHSDERTEEISRAERYFRQKLDRIMPMPSGSDEFELTTAWWMAKFSQLAYEGVEFIALSLEFIGCKKLYFFENQETEAYLARFPRRGIRPPFSVIAFRGTENDYLDILKDISILKRSILSSTGMNHKVHGGFLTAFQYIWGTPPAPVALNNVDMNIDIKGRPYGIANVLGNPEENWLEDEMNLYITGHSLGGALATVAAYNIQATSTILLKPHAVYTFGSPRVFGRELAENYHFEVKNHYRMVYDHDIVTQLPFALNFGHIKKTLYKIRTVKEIEMLKDIDEMQKSIEAEKQSIREKQRIKNLRQKDKLILKVRKIAKQEGLNTLLLRPDKILDLTDGDFESLESERQIFPKLLPADSNKISRAVHEGFRQIRLNHLDGVNKRRGELEQELLQYQIETGKLDEARAELVQKLQKLELPEVETRFDPDNEFIDTAWTTVLSVIAFLVLLAEMLFRTITRLLVKIHVYRVHKPRGTQHHKISGYANILEKHYHSNILKTQSDETSSYG